MRKTTIFIILQFCVVGVIRAQLNEAVLVDRYGSIRADMVREICVLSGNNDKALLNTIENGSLKLFMEHIKNDTIKDIISNAKPLGGTDIDQYESNLLETRRILLYKFGLYYPGKEESADECFKKYFEKINSLTNELRDEQQSISGNVDKNCNKSSKIRGNNSKNHPSSRAIIVGMIAIIIGGAIALKIRKQAFQGEEMAKEFGIVEEAGSLQKEETTEDVTTTPTYEKNIQSEIRIDSPKAYKEMSDEGNGLAIDSDEWIVVGASVQGNGHVEMGVPCQDNCAYEYLSDGWGIAIVSDGAGSAKMSHKGSAAVVLRAMYHFKSLILQEEWMTKNVLPSDIEWMKQSYRVLKQVHDEITALSHKIECEPKDLNATVIVVIHSPLGLLVVHVGDGRAGYKDRDGMWHSLLTPHKGEEANQTIFMMSDFWNNHFYEMSGVMVPESTVLKRPVAAFTLMSDGCENTSWLCYQYNEETSKYYDPNQPYAKFFDPLIETLQSFKEDNIPLEERQKKWFNFIKNGNKSFVKETDDKTMILASFYNPKERL